MYDGSSSRRSDSGEYIDQKLGNYAVALGVDGNAGRVSAGGESIDHGSFAVGGDSGKHLGVVFCDDVVARAIDCDTKRPRVSPSSSESIQDGSGPVRRNPGKHISTALCDYVVSSEINSNTRRPSPSGKPVHDSPRAVWSDP